MQSFLSFFGGLNIPKSEQDLSQEAFDARQALDFSKLVYELTENIIVDFPSFTPKISAILFRLVSRRQVGNFKKNFRNNDLKCSFIPHPQILKLLFFNSPTLVIKSMFLLIRLLQFVKFEIFNDCSKILAAIVEKIQSFGLFFRSETTEIRIILLC